MKLWELKEKLNALPGHDDDLDVCFSLDRVRHALCEKCYFNTMALSNFDTIVRNLAYKNNHIELKS